MSQFNLTVEEDAIVLTALREKANQFQMMYGAIDPTLEALVAKVQGQLEDVPVPKAKKSKPATSDE
jgi:hypothetical protein